MYKIEKKFTFPMGHRLSKHGGRCFSLHGHNFTVLVGLFSENLDENDMVMDFSDLKNMVNEIIDQFDHCLLLNETDKEFGKKVEAIGDGMRVLYVNHDPTAERLAEFLYKNIEEKIKHSHQHPIYMDYVTVFENENSKATYTE